MVILLRWPINGERMVILLVANLMEGEWSCYRSGHFNGGRMVMLQKWSLYWRENGHVADVVSFMEGEWSFYRGAHFNGHMYILLYSVVSGVLFLVYSISYLYIYSSSSSSSMFSSTLQILHTGEREGFRPAKIEQVFQNREGE